jgi:hypothetical protein
MAYWLERFARHGCRLNENATAALVEQLRRELIRGLHIARNVMLIEAAGDTVEERSLRMN